MTEPRIVQVNYWKRMLKEKKDTFEKLHGIVLLIHNSVEFSDIVDFLNNIRPEQELRLLYISLINSFDRIKHIIEKHPLESKKLFVVDCVSMFLMDVKDTADCIFRKPPKNLEQLKEMLMINISNKNPNIVMIDSMSQFINFSLPTEDELREFYKFLNSVKENIWGLKEDSIIFLYDDKFGELRGLPSVSVDLIMKLEVIREKTKWRD